MKPKIHIIGGGIAGLSCAYKLVELGMHKTHEIHIYEASDKLGGQLTHTAKSSCFMWFTFNGHYKKIADFLNVDIMPLSPSISYDRINNFWCNTSNNLDIIDIAKLTYLAIINEKDTQTSLSKFLEENKDYLSATAYDFVRYVSMSLIFMTDNLPIYSTAFYILRKSLLEPNSTYSYNNHIIIEKLHDYLVENKIRFHMNTYIISKQSNIKNTKTFFENKKELNGTFILAVDPLTAKKRFEIKIPKFLKGTNIDFGQFYTIQCSSKNVKKEFRNLDLHPLKTILRLERSLLAFIMSNTMNDTYYFGVCPMNVVAWITKPGEKPLLQCNQREFEDELLRRIGCFQYTKKNRKDIRIHYPPHIKFVDGKLRNIDKRQNMFTPVVGTYETLTPIQTDDPNVYCCGVYCQQTSDPLFTVDASIETAYKVAQLIFDNQCR